MRAIVIGAGEVGLNVARTLSADGNEVTVVEPDSTICAIAQQELDAMIVPGNGASPKLLHEVQAGRADLVAAVTEVDEVNLVAALAARQLGARSTVARVRDPEFFGPDEHFAREVLGIDFVIDPDRAAAADIKAAIDLPGAVSVEYFGDGRLGLAEVIATEASDAVGSKLEERSRPEPAYIVGYARDGKPRLTTPETVPAPGDHLLVVAPREHLESAVGHLAGDAPPVHDCVIFGGGKVGLHLARMLEPARLRVTLIERDRERARFLAERLSKTTILNEEGVSAEAQSAAGVGDAGAFVACAGDDRANLLAALTAKRLGAGLCMAVVSREEFVPLVDALAIDSAYSPRLIAAEAILRYVHSKALRGLHLLRSGFEALELEVSPGSRISGMAMGETHGLLRGCRAGAVLRGDEALVPHKGMEIRDGDRILMLGIRGSLREVEPLFADDQ